MLSFLKLLAPTLMAGGSIILALRVTQILEALVRAVSAAEESRMQIVDHLVHNAPLRATSERCVYVKDCRRIRIGLLVIGFLLIAAGAIISGINVYLAGL